MKKFKVVKTFLMNTPISLTMSVVAQVMNLLLGHISALNIGEMALSFVVSFLFAFVIGYFVPIDEWGMGFAGKLGAEMGTRKFDVLANLVVNTYFCILMTMFMTWFSMCVRGNAPIQAVPSGFLEMIGPVWVCCFVVSLLTQQPAIRITKQLCGLDRMECVP